MFLCLPAGCALPCLLIDSPILAACHVLCLCQSSAFVGPHNLRCNHGFLLNVSRRLADALDSGVTSPATRHAIEALHALATHLPTSRDLILATGAIAKLVALLRDSYAQAHYSMIKVETFPRGSCCTCKLFAHESPS